MTPFSSLLKDILGQCIAQLNDIAYMFVKHPGRDFTRKKKISLSDIIHFLLTAEKGSTKSELIDYFDYKDDAPRQSAMIQQREKLRPEALHYLLRSFTDRIPDLKKIKGYRLLAADGSALPIARNPKDLATYGITDSYGKGFNQVHINGMYDLLNYIYPDVIVQPLANKSEQRAFCQLVDRCDIDDKIIYVADRGYSSWNTIAHVMNSNQHYLFRVKAPSQTGSLITKFNVPDDEESFDIRVQCYLTRRRKIASSNPEMYKLILNSQLDYLDTREYPQKLFYIDARILKFKISDDSYEYIITNLPQREFDIDEIKELYNARWGIETSYRELKYNISLVYLHSRKFEFILQEIYAKFITYNFSQAILSHAASAKIKQLRAMKKASKAPKSSSSINKNSLSPGTDNKYAYKLNISFGMNICIQFLKQIQNAVTFNVESLIFRELSEIKPGRKAPRYVHARSPIHFIYR